MRQAVEELPQASVAVNVLFCDWLHPVLPTVPLINVTVGVPQASVADAEPRAASIFAVEGLQDATAGAEFKVIVGGVTSSVHVTVLETVDVLPQPSVAVNVLV